MNELVPLSTATLNAMPDGVRLPGYDRQALTAGIVHIGLGNFHRAHQAWYLHRLFDLGLCHDWAILGAGVRPNDAVSRERLIAQDCLTTLIELDPTGMSAEVCGSMIGYLPVEDGNGALIRAMTDPAIRIVALTVTEGGYYVDAVTGAFDTTHPDIVHDASNPETPRTAFGAMVAALKQRRPSGAGPFTGQSCDNLQGNGTVLRQAVVGLARLTDPDLADWIDTNCSFPNAMVDCIVPATGPKELELVKSFGIADNAPVTHENFRQWVIEDDFCNGRPDWDKTGATFSDRVHDFETMKLRILNGGHQVIAVPGELLGIDSIAASMANPAIRGLLQKVMTEEVVQHVAPVPGFTAPEYLDLIDRRFSNPEIADTTRRVAFDGSSRQTGFVIPSIRDGLDTGASVTGLALVSALWARYCQGVREDGSKVEPNDPNWDALYQTAGEARTCPLAWLEMERYYGDLARENPFSNAFERWLTMLNTDGTEAAINAYLNG
ncbi:mannitol dehydrogenase family protein [Sedimentitalea todarodis]|uniref:Mannitol dehydrogenase family protein n=1 Tax=Sedimentitalea todarodis TaxID=1631240 RepID=A0ABU3VG42_9RHOB|nr:mannitol dehydrogenase family protein [Sedimentitalea todarodis]MDU9005141.1 mannitol dehydrogenase family protein [Sedimentitalea todarodis]